MSEGVSSFLEIDWHIHPHPRTWVIFFNNIFMDIFFLYIMFPLGIFLWGWMLFTREGRSNLWSLLKGIFSIIGGIIGLGILFLILKVLFHVIMWAINL